MGAFQDLTGQKFGRLTVIERAENKGKQTMWLCECECGNMTIAGAGCLKSGNTKSCGCTTRKHGFFGTKIYSTWTRMKTRCYNKKHDRYKNYGGRGITVCDEWRNSFESFCDWAMKNGYADDLTIDRIDVNGNYEPNNCRWITNKEQCNNRRNNRFLTYNGKTQTISEWADEIGLEYNTLLARINHSHWDIEKALTTPLRGCTNDSR